MRIRSQIQELPIDKNSASSLIQSENGKTPIKQTPDSDNVYGMLCVNLTFEGNVLFQMIPTIVWNWPETGLFSFLYFPVTGIDF